MIQLAWITITIPSNVGIAYLASLTMKNIIIPPPTHTQTQIRQRETINPHKHFVVGDVERQKGPFTRAIPFVI